MKIIFNSSREIRLERFLHEKLPFVRRSFLQKLLRKREVKVGGSPRKGEAKIPAGAQVEIYFPDPRKYLAEISGNEILFEDGNLIAFNKRSGIAVHTGVGVRGNDLKSLAKILLNLNLIVVHRIDKGTSGVVIFAKNQAFARKLEDEFRQRRVEKIYHAVVEGIPPSEGVIEKKLLRKGKVMVVSEKGAEAKTTYKVLKKMGRKSLLEIKIESGRMHQIRIHFASLGFPIVGDEVYGRGEGERMLLHASELKILGYHFQAKLPFVIPRLDRGIQK